MIQIWFDKICWSFNKTCYWFRNGLGILRSAIFWGISNLLYLLELKVDVKVTLTCDTDHDNRLINEKNRWVMVFQGNNLQVRKTNIKCHDEKAGFKTISSNKFANTYIWIPVERSDY